MSINFIELHDDSKPIFINLNNITVVSSNIVKSGSIINTINGIQITVDESYATIISKISDIKFREKK